MKHSQKEDRFIAVGGSLNGRPMFVAFTVREKDGGRDLSDLDFSQFKPIRFEFEKKDARLNMPVPMSMMRALKQRAKARGIPYQKFIWKALEQSLGASK